MVEQSKFLERLHEHFIHRADEIYSVTISDGEEQILKWIDLEADCQAIMHSLSGIEKNVVLIFLRHSSLLHGAFLGTMMAGHIPSFMPCTSVKQDARLYWSSHQELLDHIQPVAIITSEAVSSEMLKRV